MIWIVWKKNSDIILGLRSKRTVFLFPTILFKMGFIFSSSHSSKSSYRFWGGFAWSSFSNGNAMNEEERMIKSNVLFSLFTKTRELETWRQSPKAWQLSSSRCRQVYHDLWTTCAMAEWNLGTPDNEKFYCLGNPYNIAHKETWLLPLNSQLLEDLKTYQIWARVLSLNSVDHSLITVFASRLTSEKINTSLVNLKSCTLKRLISSVQ